MIETFFLSALALILVSLFCWAFRKLPGESWQIMAAVPVHKGTDGQWSGLNLTWYGFFSACAYVMAAAVYLILMASAGIERPAAFSVLAAVLLVCAPSAKILARIIEHKSYTFTVGGAAFVGILIAPFVTRFIGAVTGWALPVLPVMAAIAVAYAFGEGLGRLACVSFGCCYGRPLSGLSPAARCLLGYWAFTFTGKTKKIAYESGLDGQKVVPVQAFSAVINSTAGLAGTVLFLLSQFGWAFLLAVVITQAWRFFSEFLRADFRGHTRISAYQKMNVAAVLYAVALAALAPGAVLSAVDLEAGLQTLWDPAMILFLQCLWVIFFLYTGRSKVTGSTLDFFVRRDRI
ncbi:MAG TPA: prolipoprotein diacylglyceryl transferase family protein [Syntrophales bacterium]|nr:prolipoprotein diacylglyceryl transferase family protein [Syntrophales bacterium]